MPTVEFYVMSGDAPDAHLRHACRIAEQAVEQGQKVFIRATTEQDAKRMDDLLWTFGDRSFLPHEMATTNVPSHPKVRILIGAAPPVEFRDVLINIANDAPTDYEGAARIAEFVPNDAERKAIARERFKHYRSLGLTPTTHNI